MSSVYPVRISYLAVGKSSQILPVIETDKIVNNEQMKIRIYEDDFTRMITTNPGFAIHKTEKKNTTGLFKIISLTKVYDDDSEKHITPQTAHYILLDQVPDRKAVHTFLESIFAY